MRLRKMTLNKILKSLDPNYVICPVCERYHNPKIYSDVWNNYYDTEYDLNDDLFHSPCARCESYVATNQAVYEIRKEYLRRLREWIKTRC